MAEDDCCGGACGCATSGMGAAAADASSCPAAAAACPSLSAPPAAASSSCIIMTTASPSDASYTSAYESSSSIAVELRSGPGRRGRCGGSMRSGAAAAGWMDAASSGSVRGPRSGGDAAGRWMSVRKSAAQPPSSRGNVCKSSANSGLSTAATAAARLSLGPADPKGRAAATAVAVTADPTPHLCCARLIHSLST
jgi:hypothetical protein